MEKTKTLAEVMQNTYGYASMEEALRNIAAEVVSGFAAQYWPISTEWVCIECADWDVCAYLDWDINSKTFLVQKSYIYDWGKSGDAIYLEDRDGDHLRTVGEFQDFLVDLVAKSEEYFCKKAA